MNLELTEEQNLLQRTVREFAESEVKPLAREIDETGAISPRKRFARRPRWVSPAWPFPESEGGAGFDHVGYAIVIEEISRVCASTGRDSLGAELTLLRSAASLRLPKNRRKNSLRRFCARRKNRLLRAHRAASGLERRGVAALAPSAKTMRTSSTARKLGSPTAAWPTLPSCT